jgi:hypothetical protein
MEMVCEEMDWIHLLRKVSSEHGNGYSCSIKAGKFFDYLLLRDSDLWR